MKPCFKFLISGKECQYRLSYKEAEYSGPGKYSKIIHYRFPYYHGKVLGYLDESLFPQRPKSGGTLIFESDGEFKA
jgi:hypothetical protein